MTRLAPLRRTLWNRNGSNPMTPSNHTARPRRTERGFALILALLALMLLTSLGLALSAGTSSELQIATNHRWSEQARYNAEAGVEFAREFLSGVSDWGTILPPPRNAGGACTDANPGYCLGWAATVTPPADAPDDAPQSRNDAFGNPPRNFENWDCDARGYGRGYGVVLDDGVSPGAPFQFTSSMGGAPLNGAFTLWIRRPVQWKTDTGGTAETLQDYPANDVLVLVSEGVAPYTAYNSATRVANRASHIVEVLLSNGGAGSMLLVGGQTQCTTRQGQAGGNSQGTNSQGCTTLDGSSLLPAVAGAANLGTGNLR